MILHLIHVRDKTMMLSLLLYFLHTAKVTASVTLTASPSQNIEANNVVTMMCSLDPNVAVPPVIYFNSNGAVFCTIEHTNGSCKSKSSSCLEKYNASCPSERVFSVSVPVSFDWNGKNISCSSFYSHSNYITLSVTVQVTTVNLTSASNTVIVGQKYNLSCSTSFCFPKADIRWFMSSTDITNQSFVTTDGEGLVRTNSSLLLSFNKTDKGKQVHCEASNKPNQHVNSATYTVTVLYKPELTSNTSRTYRVTEDNTATLECTLVDASPETGIKWRWFKTNEPNRDLFNGPIYTIQNIQRERSGSYECTANNEVGTSDPIKIDVDVQYKPNITSNTKSPYVTKEGQNALLECRVIIANPGTILAWKWFKTASPNSVLYDGPTFTIFNIQRNMSGSFTCTAENTVGISNAINFEVDVQYKPEIKAISPNPYRVSEGKTATLQCALTAANPNTSITWNWFIPDNPKIAVNPSATYNISSIQRTMSGSYNCTASNIVGTSAAISIKVDVQYKPKIEEKTFTVVNESEKVILTREIYSNPLSNVSWYNGSQFVYTQYLVKKATLIIEKASCTDTTNFTILASNTEDENVTATVELFVNCKPKPYVTNITLGVTDTTGIEFSTTIIAYPEPHYELRYENGTQNLKMVDSITRHSLYNFTIHFNQTMVEQSDYGTYILLLNNLFGEDFVYVNVIPQRKPTMPIIEKSYCEETRAKVQWKSSFNGGAIQLFTVIALNSQQQQSKSDNISDRGKNKIHFTYVQNLQPSTTYVFYVSAQNRHGLSSSKHISCTTKEVSRDSFAIIAGGATAGGISLTIVVVVIIVLLRRYTKQEKQTVKSERLHQDGESDDTNDDGMRDNILYISAGPKVDEKPEAAVYAAVNKNVPESDNNANVYAEVKKSGNVVALHNDVKPKRGLFKKDASGKKGGNPKQKKGKQQKSKHLQDVADVYENSEDIAMSSKSDNVYSNTGQKVQNKEERGYKNKDGLLYVEVQFDAKTEKGNQTIHGEDEKTDYATVEFPMAASANDE